MKCFIFETLAVSPQLVLCISIRTLEKRAKMFSSSMNCLKQLYWYVVLRLMEPMRAYSGQ